MNDYEKIRIFIQVKNLTIKDFCETIGVSLSFFSSSRRKKSSATITSLGKIVQGFPDFDVVGFVLVQSEQEWRSCIFTHPPPPQNIDKKQISKRLLTFFKEIKINSLALHIACGFGYGFISSLQYGTAGFTTDTLRKIFNGFPELSPKWLILGEGEMMKKDVIRQNIDSNAIFSEQIETMQATEAKLLANTQELRKAITQPLIPSKELLKLQKERGKIASKILVEQQQFKKIIKEYTK